VLEGKLRNLQLRVEENVEGQLLPSRKKKKNPIKKEDLSTHNRGEGDTFTRGRVCFAVKLREDGRRPVSINEQDTSSSLQKGKKKETFSVREGRTPFPVFEKGKRPSTNE